MLVNRLGNIFAFFIVYRLIFPIIYLSHYIIAGGAYFTVAIAMLLSLLTALAICSYITLFVSPSAHQHGKLHTHKSLKYIILILVVVIFNSNLPILQGSGSNSISELSETNKFQTWIGFVLLELCYMQFIVSAVFSNKRINVILLLCAAVLIGGLSFSKAIVFAVMAKFITFRFFLGRKTPMVTLLFGSLGAIVFTLFVYQFTEGNNIFSSLQATLWAAVDLVRYSSTFVYMLILERGGIELIDNYAALNNKVFGINYFLNPVLAAFGHGITQAIGPFLNMELFQKQGSSGVNPTIFVELMMIYNKPTAALLAPILTVGLLSSAYYLIKLSVKKKSEFEVALIAQIGVYFITAMSDSLFAVRSIIPLVVILLIFRFLKLIHVRNS